MQPFNFRQIWILAISLTVAASTTARGQEDANPRVTPTVQLVRKVLPAVVSVRVERAAKKPNVIEHGHGGGSVIHEDGYILTNNHVVAGAKKVEVAFFQDNWTKVRVIARLPSEDLALLKFESDEPLPVLPLGRSDDLELGEPVITVGSAGGLPHTLSTGIISGLGRSTNTEHAHLPEMVQTTAPISGGSSGGALINALGQQVGVITSRKSDGENLGFAITVDRVREVFPDLVNVQERFGLLHGMMVDPFHDGGAKVTALAEDSPASSAALLLGDVIHAIGDHSIENAIDFHLAMVDHRPGEVIALKVKRGEEDLELSLTPKAAPQSEPVKVEGLKPGLRVERFIGEWQKLPDFNTLTPEDTFITDKSPATSSDAAKDHYGERFTGFIRIPKDELYTFSITSDDGSRLYVGGRLVADNDGPHSEEEVVGTRRLRQGDYSLRIEYFEGTGDQMLRVEIEDELGKRRELPPEWLFHRP